MRISDGEDLMSTQPTPATEQPPGPVIDDAAPFAGRSAVVTGAGRGIGRAIALALAAGGARVALVARSHDQLTRVADELADAGGSGVVVVADLAEADRFPRLLSRLDDELGPVDILINNAALIAPVGPTVSIDPDAWAAAFTLNVMAPVRLTVALLPAMLAHGWGRVVNVSSGVVAHPGSLIGTNAYTASKAALEAHSVNLAAETAHTGVTVNVYRPGRVDTSMQEWVRTQDRTATGTALVDRFTDDHAAGRLIPPAQSAAALLRRLPGASTGQIWSVTDSQ